MIYIAHDFNYFTVRLQFIYHGTHISNSEIFGYFRINVRYKLLRTEAAYVAKVIYGVGLITHHGADEENMAKEAKILCNWLPNTVLKESSVFFFVNFYLLLSF